MPIANSLNTNFDTCEDTSRKISSARKRIDAFNVNEAEIATAKSELKAKADEHWTGADGRMAAKLNEREHDQTREEVSIRGEIRECLTALIDTDYPAAKNKLTALLDDLKAKAKSHLLAFGWNEKRINDDLLSGCNAVHDAMVNLDAISGAAGLRYVREENDNAIAKAKQRFAGVKAKAFGMAG